MTYIIVGFISLSIGFIIGFAVSAIMTANSNSENIQEAYNLGIKNGKENTENE